MANTPEVDTSSAHRPPEQATPTHTPEGAGTSFFIHQQKICDDMRRQIAANSYDPRVSCDI